MVPFKTFLSEALDKPYAGTMLYGANVDRFTFKTDAGHKYMMTFNHQGGDIPEIQFTMIGTSNLSGMGILGTGDSFRVFSTVLHRIIEYVRAKSPKGFYFHSKEASRTKLYKRLAKMLSRALPYESHVDVMATQTRFVFSKAGA